MFGWEYEEIESDETGRYFMALLDGRRVAGIHQQPDDLVKSGEAGCWWNCYVAVEDIEATAALARELGLDTDDPKQFMDLGRYSRVFSKAAALFFLWEPLAFEGFEVSEAPGSFCFPEMTTDGVEAALDTYGKLFGWRLDLSSPSLIPTERDAPLYRGDVRVAMLGRWERSLGKMRGPAYCNPVFRSVSVELATGLVEANGGEVSLPPLPTGEPWIARCDDPLGAWFSVSGPNTDD